MVQADWEQIKTYGKANKYRLSKKHLTLFAALFCFATPGTNWLVPLLPKIIKKDLYYIRRYE